MLLIKGLLLGVIQFNSISKCRLLITFTNSLDPDQARACSGSKLFETLIVFLKEFFEKVDFKKNQQTTKKREKFPRGQRVKYFGLRG